jgi:phage tail P2-like protein
VFYAPVVALEAAQAITVARYVDQDTHFAPTFFQSLGIPVSRFIDADVIYAPAVALQPAQVIAPSCFVDNDIFFWLSPRGDYQYLEPTLFRDTDVFFTPVLRNVQRYDVIEHAGSQVLYPAASGLEKSVADVEAERVLSIADWLVEDQWDPYLISKANLPYLAWAMGVNLWEDSYWSEGSKRDWVAQQWSFKAYRGAPKAYEMALKQSDYVITDTVRPPQGFWLAPSLTKEQWDAWIRQMPEIRLTHAEKEGTRSDVEAFIDTNDWAKRSDSCFLDYSFFGINDGFVLSGRVANLRRFGVDTPMEVIEYHGEYEDLPNVDYERVSSTGKSTKGVFSSMATALAVRARARLPITSALLDTK